MGVAGNTLISTIYEDDYPGDVGVDEVGDNGRVEFNFRRNPAPQGVKASIKLFLYTLLSTSRELLRLEIRRGRQLLFSAGSN